MQTVQGEDYSWTVIFNSHHQFGSGVVNSAVIITTEALKAFTCNHKKKEACTAATSVVCQKLFILPVACKLYHCATWIIN